ncbi:pentatricopeptide repeat-containing protein At3g29230 [Cryptomeria japonica]|uniref:pentatricopeptide repeat-containing protein At3g29230 n=1 Tax=Cryptomeria japonica TaxID=3369 RepID=UPI0025AD9CCF|nr:pentatricopeptide repeat-containing protein At3g29230 [Cryptomeria japonica]
MYAKCGSIQKARELFDKNPQRSVVSWNAMISGYAHYGAFDKALRLFQEMPERSVVSWNAMIVGYAQKGVLDEAVRVFNEMPQPNVISWTAIIAGYTQNGFVEKALDFFQQMKLNGVKPNSATFASILPVCAKMGASELGMQIHQKLMESNLASDVKVANALLDMYPKCGNIHMAEKLFDKMPQRDAISWNSMIAGYS